MILKYGFYPTQGNKLEYTLALPEVKKEEYPLLIQFHGSGWNIGGRNSHLSVAEAMTKAGIAVLLPAYRVKMSHGASPEDAVRDAVNIYNYVLLQPEQFCAQKDAIILGGGSSGAQLAFMAAKRTGIKPVCFMFENPAFDDVILQERCEEFNINWKELSPYEQLERDTAPMIISHAKDDNAVPFSYIERFCDKAQSMGVNCVLNVYENGGHGFYMPTETLQNGINYFSVMAANLQFFENNFK